MSDPRFARLKTDPRFRRPKVKQTKVVIDQRFKSVFQSSKSIDGPKVDKYGRPVSASEKGDDLRRYYRLANDAEDSLHSRTPDLARGEVLLESSDEEEQTVHDSEDDGGFVTLGANREEDGFLEVDLDEHNYAGLDLQAETYAAKEEDSAGETIRTSRLAIVNLDWDHVRAQHLYKISSSLVSPSAPSTSSTRPRPNYDRQKGSSMGSIGHGPVHVVRGQVRSVRVYPSEFGKERLEREEKEGPPKEIFNNNNNKEGAINERSIYELGDGDEGEYDEDALRKYQLERLRYYYAIVECDSIEAATHIYNELEGTELERSANVFELSFVPDGMTFEGEPRDEATEDLNTEYKPVEFVTDALRHSKVKLTWDDDDPERHHVTRRLLTKKEIEEEDFKDYVVGSSSDEDGDGNQSKSKREQKGKKDKYEHRDKLRALLLGGNEDELPEGWGADLGAHDDENGDDDVDMEITFMPALSKKVGDETTLETYRRKVREKRKKRKEGRNEAVAGREEADDFFRASGDESDGSDRKEEEKEKRGLDKQKKGGRNDKSENGGGESQHKEVSAAELALLVAPEKHTDEPKHFNLKSVIKAEKAKKRKGNRRKEPEDNEVQEDFVMNVKDERFKALFEDHQFAVDPSNPHFKKTKAMNAIVEERQKRRKGQVERAEGVHTTISNAVGSGTNSNFKGLQSLVESVKRKSMNADTPGVGKRRKL